MPDGETRGVLVLGGTGGVGEACVRALLAGSLFERVIASSRDPRKLDDLRARLGFPERLIALAGSVATTAEAEDLRARVSSQGDLGAVVASLGGWWESRGLLEIDEATWRSVIDELLTPHFIAARTFVPLLERGGVYLALGGGAALTPVPHSALVSVAAAAQQMFVRAVVAERPPGSAPRIEELLVDGPVKTRGRHHGPPQPGEITADEVATVVRCLVSDGTTGDWPQIARRGPIIVMSPRMRPMAY